MQLRRLLGTTLAVASTVGAIVVATAPAATAATPTQSTIDGEQAREMGCRADSTVIYHVVIDGGGEQRGYVDLVASNYCHAVWVHAHGVRVVQNQTYVPHGTVHRNSDGREYRCTGGEGTQDCYTPMVWDKGVTSYGIGEIDPNGAVSTHWVERTSSY